jgi:hypothetical protein
MNALSRKELVWVLGFSQTIEEQRQIMMVVQLLQFDLPRNFVAFCVVL